VQAILPRLVTTCRDLLAHGVNSVAIMANDTQTYPQDSFEQMQLYAQRYAFPFPYLWDQTQAVAKAYDAVCTPDFFGFNRDLLLQYRGRFDASGAQAHEQTPGRRELFDAMVQIAKTGKGPQQQTPSIGCSIKWLVN